MNIKLRDVAVADEALRVLYDNTELNARESYGIMKLGKAMRDDVAFFYLRRTKLLTTYGTEDPKEKGKFNVPKEKAKEYTDAMEELGNEPVEIRAEPVKLRGDILGITPKVLQALDPFVTVDR